MGRGEGKEKLTGNNRGYGRRKKRRGMDEEIGRVKKIEKKREGR